jgi:hypothetical protein
MKPLKISALLLILLIALSAQMFAQSDRGTIRGTVTDPNGGVIPNAKVTVASQEMGDARDTTTTDEGAFVFPELPAGLYRLTVEATGFRRSAVENVKVDVQGVQSLNLKLEIGEITGAVVNVDAEQVVINTDTPVRQTTVTERQVRELPLAVNSESGGRTPLAFIFLDSNVNASQTGGGTNASSFKVSGGQAQGTEILIDGASAKRQQNGTFFTEVGPGPNAYREFTISTSSFSAEFGNSSGGIVNFTLKSGTNQFHGEAYDLVRNEVFNANSLYNNARGIPRNRDNQNNFGFNVGGPIYIPRFGEGTPPFWRFKDRAFFFFNYEGYRFRQGVNGFVTVPTLRMRNGDFGELLTDPAILHQFPGGIHIYNPHLPQDQRLTPLANNVVPAGLIDPVGFAIINSFPSPNRPGAFENYQFSNVIPNDANQWTLKTDFNLSAKQHLTFSYFWRKNTRIAAQGGSTVVFLDPYPNLDIWQQSFGSQLGRIQHDYSITSSLLNHLNIGYSFFDVANRNMTDPFNTSSLGFPVNATQNITFPTVDFPGYGGIGSTDVRRIQGIGSTFFTDRLRDATLQISDSVTWIKGRHSFKFGADYRINQFNVRQYIHGGGQFNFRNDQTASDIDPNGGYPLASLITGATEWSWNNNTTIEPAYRQFSQSYFAQDDFKITQKLTLNLGLRYDLPGLRTEAHDRFRGFDPNVINPLIGRPGAIVGAVGQSGLQAEFRSLAPSDKTNIGPRFGAAWAINNKTVIRGGIGLYYSPVLLGNGGQQAELQTGTLGFNTDALHTPAGAGSRTSTAFLSTYPSIPTSNPNDQFVGRTDINSFYYFDPNHRSGRTLQYSMDVQRELPFNLVASVGYVGHRADHLRSNFDRINSLPLNALRLGNDILTSPIYRIDPTDPGYDPVFASAARSLAQSVGITLPATMNSVYPGFQWFNSIAQALRPFPQYGDIFNILESKGESTYNGVQFKLDRRFAQGLQFGASYTYSRLITNASENLLGDSPLTGVMQNPFEVETLKTDSPTHSRHVFVTNFLYELPFGKGRAFLDRGGIVDRIVGGFQISGIFRYQSGTPLVISLPAASNFLRTVGYNGNLRPNLTGQPIFLSTSVPTGVGLERVLDTAAFTAPRDFGGVPLIVNGAVNPNYASYYSDPNNFFGTAPPVLNDALSPMYFNEDISILKKTRITETVTFEIGAEFFNVFNRVRFLPPDVNLGSNFSNGNFGVQGAVDSPRVIQFRGRLIF